MSEVAVSINGREYSVSCEAGQEAMVRQLAKYLDLQVTRLAQDIGQVGDARLLLMAGLVIADELSEALEDLQKTRTSLRECSEERDRLAERVEDLEHQMSNALENAAGRIEAAAGLLDSGQRRA